MWSLKCGIRGNLCPQSQSCVRRSTSVDKSSNRAWHQIGILYYGWGQNQMRSKCGAKMKKPRPHVTGRWSQRQKGLRSKDAIDHTTNDQPLSGFIHNNAWGTTDLSENLSAQRIRSCSTKKSLRLQSLFDTWLTRFQIRIDKMCTNLYNLCIKHRKNCECCPGHYLSTSVY